MNDHKTAKHRANAATAIALGMEAAVDQGCPDSIIAEELIRITMALIASASGGQPLPAVLRNIADTYEANPDAPVTIN